MNAGSGRDRNDHASDCMGMVASDSTFAQAGIRLPCTLIFRHWIG